MARGWDFSCMLHEFVYERQIRFATTRCTAPPARLAHSGGPNGSLADPNESTLAFDSAETFPDDTILVYDVKPLLTCS